MRYCTTCEKRTDSVYNDFMVEFCADCHTLRDYPLSGELRAFQCIHCGRMLDEVYVGQSVCLDCRPDEER